MSTPRPKPFTPESRDYNRETVRANLIIRFCEAASPTVCGEDDASIAKAARGVLLYAETMVKLLEDRKYYVE